MKDITREYEPDTISESTVARLAWWVSLIPLLGVLLFIALAFVALYHIGSKGQTGFWLLWRGVMAVLLINGLYLGLYFSGYSGYYKFTKELYFLFPKHGIERLYYESGKIKCVQHWNFGRENGKMIMWYKNGNKMLELEYIDGERSGSFVFWHKNGYKFSECNYQKGRIEGISKYWDEFGKILRVETWSNGNLVSSENYSPSNITFPFEE